MTYGFVRLLIRTKSTIAGLLSKFYLISNSGLIPKLSTRILMVRACNRTITNRRHNTLVPQCTRRPILKIRIQLLKLFSKIMTIIGPIPTPIVRRTRNTKDAIMAVFRYRKNRTTYSTQIIICVQVINFTKVKNIRTNSIRITPRLPNITRIMSRFNVTTVLLGLRIIAISINAIMQTNRRTTRAPFPRTIKSFHLRNIMKAMSCLHVNFRPILLRLTNSSISGPTRYVKPMRSKNKATRRFRPFNRRTLMNINSKVPRRTRMLQISICRRRRTNHESSNNVRPNTCTTRTRTSYNSHKCTMTRSTTTYNRGSKRLLNRYERSKKLMNLFRLLTIRCKSNR